MTRTGDIRSRVDYFFEEPYIAKEELGWKNQSTAEVLANLKNLKDILLKIPENQFNKDKIEKCVIPLTKEVGVGEVLWPMRFALSGKRASPGPFEIADILGKEKSIIRITKAIELLAP